MYKRQEDNKFRTWRRLWIALARAEQAQGLEITDEQIAELEAHKDDINYDVAVAREKEVRHDVMSHVYAYGVQCPKAKGIIHLGATSCYVGDNTDILVMKQALEVARRKLVNVMALLADFADKYKEMPALAYTCLLYTSNRSGRKRGRAVLRVAVLVSGGGTNLQALLDEKARGGLKNAEFALVVSSRPGVFALERAQKDGVPTAVIARRASASAADYDQALLKVCLLYTSRCV